MTEKIPPHATCVFQGILFDVYQWQQEMFDGSFRTFEKIRRRTIGAQVIATRGDRIFYSQEQQP